LLDRLHELIALLMRTPLASEIPGASRGVHVPLLGARAYTGGMKNCCAWTARNLCDASSTASL
jgi:hypothetical protein